MLKLCEDYALKHSNIFNTSKSQLLYFPSNTTRVPKELMLKMNSGPVIPYNNNNTYCTENANLVSTFKIVGAL